MSASAKIFLCFFALLVGGVAVLFSAHSSCSKAKNDLDNAKAEFTRQLSELSQLATKIAAMNKMAFPENKPAVRKVELVQVKLEQNLTAAEIIRAQEILDGSLKTMLKELFKNKQRRKSQNLVEIASSFKIVSQRASDASTNFFSKAESYNRTLEGFLPKCFSPLMDFQPEQIYPPAKKNNKRLLEKSK